MSRYNKLYSLIKEYVSKGSVVAFSGGVDSSLVLKLACMEGEKQNKEVHSVTFETRLHPMGEIDLCKKLAEDFGSVHHNIQLNEFENPLVMANTRQRCYECKKSLFEKLLQVQRKYDLTYGLDGTNHDDLSLFRPGLRALTELGIKSPLAESGISKEDVRRLAEDLGIAVANRPSAPCMATRFPYGTRLDYEKIKKVDEAENFIKTLGFSSLRLRLHEDVARLEFLEEDIIKAINLKKYIIKGLKERGFKYITLDLQAFRSGSMDE